MTETIAELTAKEFESFTKKGLVLVDFWADWCMPCLMMEPVMDELSAKFKGKIKFGKINVDENQKVAEKFQVRSIPNFILFRDGEVKDRFVGAMDESDFEDKLREHIQ